MGASFAAKFAAADFSVRLVAEGQRYDRLKRDGVFVNSQHWALPVVKPSEDHFPVDLLLVALKHHHLATALTGIDRLVGDQTAIISVMNGLDSERLIGAVCGMEKMLYAIAVGIDAVRDGHRVHYSNPGRLVFGEARNESLSERVRRVQTALTRAAIPHETPQDMLRALWWKFMVNVGMNQASAVMRAPYGVFQAKAEARGLMKALMLEVIPLAEAEGVDLQEVDVDEWLTILPTLAPSGKTSMLQDIEAGRKTEVEIFAGRVVALGRGHDIPTPVNQTLLQIIQVLEHAPEQ